MKAGQLRASPNRGAKRVCSRAPAPTPQDRAQLVSAFYNSPDDALFDQKTLAAVLSRTTAWAEMARWKGDGPKFIRVGKRSVLYQKRAILQWLQQFSESNFPPRLAHRGGSR